MKSDHPTFSNIFDGKLYKTGDVIYKEVDGQIYERRDSSISNWPIKTKIYRTSLLIRNSENKLNL